MKVFFAGLMLAGTGSVLPVRSETPPPPPPPQSAVFMVFGDTHFDEGTAPQDNARMLKAMRRLSDPAAPLAWPAESGGAKLSQAGRPMEVPACAVAVGDLCYNIGGSNLLLFHTMEKLHKFRGCFERGLPLPLYAGLGNHDLHGDDATADARRADMWGWIASRYGGEKPAVPVIAYDKNSGCYAWNLGGALAVMTHTFAGDSSCGRPAAWRWLRDLLRQHAANGRPVLLFQHYSLDPFGTQPRWWTKQDQETLAEILKPYHVIGIFCGHSHAAARYRWHGIPVFQTNNATPEIREGNGDGPGSFYVARVNGAALEVVCAKVVDDRGKIEWE